VLTETDTKEEDFYQRDRLFYTTSIANRVETPRMNAKTPIPYTFISPETLGSVDEAEVVVVVV
jgi:hypothetical protein